MNPPTPFWRRDTAAPSHAPQATDAAHAAGTADGSPAEAPDAEFGSWATDTNRTRLWRPWWAVTLLALSVVAVATQWTRRTLSRDPSSGAASAPHSAPDSTPHPSPAAALNVARTLDLSGPRAPAPAAPAGSAPRIPAISLLPQEDGAAPARAPARSTPAGEPANPAPGSVMVLSQRATKSAAEPRSAAAEPPQAAGPASGRGGPLEDRRDAAQATLDLYQRQIQRLAQPSSASAWTASGAAAGATPGDAGAGGSEPEAPAPAVPAATPRTAASMLANRSFTLPKGSVFTCALTTRLISAISGFVGCLVQRNVYGDDGRVLLIERGSHLDGQYRAGALRPGSVRLPVLWTRLRTPLGVSVDLDSPATGPLGEAGVDGSIDPRWAQRIGSALLLSLLDDTVKGLLQLEAGRSRASSNGSTVILPPGTDNSSKLAEQVLGSTLDLAPLIERSPGDLLAIYVARDLDFSGVYGLQVQP